MLLGVIPLSLGRHEIDRVSVGRYVGMGFHNKQVQHIDGDIHDGKHISINDAMDTTNIALY